jgi:hypothetical protein
MFFGLVISRIGGISLIDRTVNAPPESQPPGSGGYQADAGHVQDESALSIPIRENK